MHICRKAKAPSCVDFVGGLGLILLMGTTFVSCASYPRVLSPRGGGWVLEAEVSTRCAAGGPCHEIYVKGKVPRGFWAFIAVAPLAAAPRMWIQPPVLVARDGSFEGVAYLGNEREGIGERYHILVIAHPDRNRFEAGEVLAGFPEKCRVSSPVTVRRDR